MDNCKYGDDMEPIIIKKFRDKHPEYQIVQIETNCVNNIRVYKKIDGTSMSTINVSFRCDALVNDDAILEVKARGGQRKGPIDSLSYATKSEEGKFTLKRNDRYYDQIQLYMFLTGRETTYFAVGNDDDYVELEVISKDEERIKELSDEIIK